MRNVGRKTRIFLDNCDVVVNAAYNEGKALQIDSLNELLQNTLEIHLEKFMDKFVKVHFFGSRIVGLANAKSDLDIFLEMDNNYYADKDVSRDAIQLQTVALALKESSLWKIVLNITNASIPVLKTIYVPRNLHCDITVSNGLGVQNSLIMGYFFNLQPEIAKFYHLMKALLPRYNVNFDGYLLKLLIIFYFQNESFLPSVIKVQEGLPVKTINGWNVQFDSNRDLSFYKNKLVENYKHHIPNFFKFYAIFTYKKHIMSVHSGTKILRSYYQNNEEIKDEYQLCIFGPINKSHNIGKSLKKDNVLKFINKCEGIFFGFLKYHPWNVAYEKNKKMEN